MNISHDNCSNEFPSIKTLYSELGHQTGSQVLTIITGILCAAMLINYIDEIRFLILNKRKIGRYKVMFLLGLYPVTSLLSLLLLCIPVTTLVVEMLSALYLSLSIFIFMRLIFDYFGGRECLRENMEGESITFTTPPLCCLCRRCVKPFPFNSKTFGFVRTLVFQVIFIRPIANALPLILWLCDIYHPGDESDPKNPVFYTHILNSLSSVMSIWGLVVLFRATKSKLESFSIQLKFTSLQLVILFSSLQFTIITQLARNGVIPCVGTRGPLIRGSRLQHMVLIIEIFLVSIIARFTYRRDDEPSTYELM